MRQSVNKVIIFGNCELSAVNYFYLTHDSCYEVIAFTTDKAYIKHNTSFGLPVIPFEHIETVYDPAEYQMSILLGFRDMNHLRSNKYMTAKSKGYKLLTYVSSKAIIWPGIQIGENCYIHENAVIQPFAVIGNNVVISAGSLVGHHSYIKDHCFLAANATILGSVIVEPYCVVGANATIMDGITVERECIIGAGSLITKDAREGEFYVGRSAELLSKTSRSLAPLLTWSHDVQRSGRSHYDGEPDESNV
jgi:sugar O-acyltransferase (sialic acid O-acetyltransferase NeuD family)